MRTVKFYWYIVGLVCLFASCKGTKAPVTTPVVSPVHNCSLDIYISQPSVSTTIEGTFAVINRRTWETRSVKVPYTIAQPNKAGELINLSVAISGNEGDTLSYYLILRSNVVYNGSLTFTLDKLPSQLVPLSNQKTYMEHRMDAIIQ